jgi:nucleoside-diphosphate-sugar epimerase
VTAAAPSLSGETVLVTGASGFIGGALCRRLARDGAQVHAVARGAAAELPLGVRARRGDLTDSDEVRRIFRELRPAVVFHLAGHVQGSRALDQVLPALAGNLLTTVHVLHAAAETGCERIVLTGSQDEPDPGEAGATEFVPPSPYAAAKLAGSAYARMFRELYACPVSIARIFMGYGPGQRDLTKLLPYTILCFLRGEAPRIGSGARPMDWIYVDDVVEGLLRSAKAAAAVGRVIDLGTGELHTARDAVERVAACMSPRVAPEYGALADRKLERARCANVQSTQTLLGWRPEIGFDEGLRRTVEWYREQFVSGVFR